LVAASNIQDYVPIVSAVNLLKCTPKNNKTRITLRLPSIRRLKTSSNYYSFGWRRTLSSKKCRR